MTLKHIELKKFVVVVSEILRLFVTILTTGGKYFLSVKASVYRNKFKCNYVEIKKYFLNFFLHFRNVHKFLNTLKERWGSEVLYSWNHRLQKVVLLKCLKNPVSEHLWALNMVRGPKHCLNQHGSIFFRIFWSVWKKIRPKNSGLVVSEILRLFVNILTPDGKCSLLVKASV